MLWIAGPWLCIPGLRGTSQVLETCTMQRPSCPIQRSQPTELLFSTGLTEPWRTWMISRTLMPNWACCTPRNCTWILTTSGYANTSAYKTHADTVRHYYLVTHLLHDSLLFIFLPSQLLADCLTIVIAATMGISFTADVQAAWQKFLAVVVSALCRQYH